MKKLTHFLTTFIWVIWVGFAQSQSFSSNADVSIHFIKEEINDFESLVAQFKGKVILIDIWATWCGPCRKEFKHKGKQKLLAFAQKNDIILLYISGDRPEAENTWQNLVNDLKLSGYHIRMNEKMKESIRDKFSRPYKKGTSLFYPTYAIVNRQGEIVDKNAHRPSEGRKLISSLERILN
jgi:thiol-disulfide isomerase/thioredoxin